MKTLFGFGVDVPASRVIADHRRWLLPVGALLAVNLVVLIAVVLPLRQSVRSGASRADASNAALRAAMADLKSAEGLRDGQAQAAKDLDRFYAEVLPRDFATARRVTHIKLVQLARSHDVTIIGASASTEELDDSTLERLHVNYSLVGDWEDIRRFIYEIETGADFLVIDTLRLSEAEANGPLTLMLDLSTYYRIANAGP